MPKEFPRKAVRMVMKDPAYQKRYSTCILKNLPSNLWTRSWESPATTQIAEFRRNRSKNFWVGPAKVHVTAKPKTNEAPIRASVSRSDTPYIRFPLWPKENLFLPTSPDRDSSIAFARLTMLIRNIPIPVATIGIYSSAR